MVVSLFVFFLQPLRTVFVEQVRGQVRLFGMKPNKMKLLVMLVTINMDFMTGIRGIRN